VAVARSRSELERVLGQYGATDLAFVEVDSAASIQFALEGRYVQLALPLPDPGDARFTLTPTGRQRGIVAQERAYEQALRQHWRALLLAVKGKLQSVESGISTFDAEFGSFLVRDDRASRRRRDKGRNPRAVNWLLGSSHTIAIALVAAFLVPASAVGAFALPPSLVGHLSAPFRTALPAEAGQDKSPAGVALALGSNDWSGFEAVPAAAASAPSSQRLAPRRPASQSLDAGEIALESAATTDVPTLSDSGSAPSSSGGEAPAAPSPLPPPASPHQAPAPSATKPKDNGKNTPGAPPTAGNDEDPNAPSSEESSSPNGGSDGSEGDPESNAPAAGDEDAGNGNDQSDKPGNGNGNDDKDKDRTDPPGNANGHSELEGNGNGNANPNGNGNGNDYGNSNPPGNASGQDDAKQPGKPTDKGKGK
jgi:hypothetical protein